MKSLVAILTILFIGCSLSPQKNKNKSFDDNFSKMKVILYAEEGDTFRFTNGELKQIYNLFPALDTASVTDPEFSYAKSESSFGKPDYKEFINSEGKKDSVFFQSELDEDEYYILYAYFLKQKNGDEKYKSERENLIKLYRDINGIFEGLANGGTGFGHSHRRIVGYAEYSIYLYSQIDSLDDNYIKKYNMDKQKQLYINSLKQIISDEESVDTWTIDKEGKLERKREFQKLVNDIEDLVTSYFYLKMAQQFQYSHY